MTTVTELTVNQVVQVQGIPGFFKVCEVRPKDVVLYGGTMHRGGKLYVRFRFVQHDKIQPIISKATQTRATAFIRALEEAMESAPKPKQTRRKS